MDRPRLLIVDDDPCTRFALNSLFSRQGWQVALAGTVAEGLAGLEPAPHLLILDLNLPDGGGEVILEAVRSRCFQTRVAVCSGLEDPNRLLRVRGFHPDLMLWKPIELAPVFRLGEVAMAASAPRAG